MSMRENRARLSLGAHKEAIHIWHLDNQDSAYRNMTADINQGGEWIVQVLKNIKHRNSIETCAGLHISRESSVPDFVSCLQGHVCKVGIYLDPGCSPPRFARGIKQASGSRPNLE